ncbi:MAG: hypothetical protein Ct9H300mP21_00920 [Pseudomonadota bacterium]|nr:MAG: hypothetical protein Ct9H300mP21_00920 [Pseudomonadota bacterium]
MSGYTLVTCCLELRNILLKRKKSYSQIEFSVVDVWSHFPDVPHETAMPVSSCSTKKSSAFQIRTVTRLISQNDDMNDIKQVHFKVLPGEKKGPVRL